MKTIKLFGLVTTALMSLGQPAWAGPHGGGGGFGGGAQLGGSHFGGNPGGIRAGPAFSSGAHFGGRSLGGLHSAPQQFSYYGGTRTSAVNSGVRTSAVRPRGFNGSVTRSVSSHPVNRTATTRQLSPAGSMATRNRVPSLQTSRTTNRGSFNTNRASARHDANWHRDWNQHLAHFDHGRMFVFIDGFWWGFYPWDYYPYYGYGYDPYDYSYGYPYDYQNYDGYPSDSYNEYSYYNGYAPPGQPENSAVRAVQSRLQTLGYYHGAIDGILGDETQAALTRYQQDKDLSVTGIVTAATLQALGLSYSAGF